MSEEDDARALLQELLMGGIHEPNPVEIEPDAKLSQWRVYELEIPLLKGVTRHFVGYNHVTGEGRVSSPIVSWDPATRQGITRSGRRYELLGPPGVNAESEYVFAAWLRSNQASKLARVDVSSEYVTLIT
jgi:hypothetical protein